MAAMGERLTGDRQAPDHVAEGAPRPRIERAGLAAIAALITLVFGWLALAAWSSGEVFLGVMAGIGALMTVWAAGSTVRR